MYANPGFVPTKGDYGDRWVRIAKLAAGKRTSVSFQLDGFEVDLDETAPLAGYFGMTEGFEWVGKSKYELEYPTMDWLPGMIWIPGMDWLPDMDWFPGLEYPTMDWMPLSYEGPWSAGPELGLPKHFDDLVVVVDIDDTCDESFEDDNAVGVVFAPRKF